MTLRQIATPILGVLTAASSFIAAYYWYLSSEQEPAEILYTFASVSDNPEAHIGEAHAEMYALQKAYKDTSALNKTLHYGVPSLLLPRLLQPSSPAFNNANSCTSTILSVNS